MQMATPRRRTALVVDDDRTVRGLLAEVLAVEGYAVLQAASGPEGLQLAREHHPQVVLLDLQLPPTSGMAVLDELRRSEATRYIPVVVVSGEHPPDRDGEAPCPDGVLRKPFDVGELLAHVARVTETAEPSEAHRE
jgi:CheY-like chemotaxis protein